MDAELEPLRRALGEASWQARVAAAQRREHVLVAIREAMNTGTPMAEAVARLVPGVRPATVLRWWRRWQERGLAGLIDRWAGSRRPGAAGPPEPSATAAQLTLIAVPPAAPRAPAERRRAARGPRPLPLVKWSGSKAAMVDRLLAAAPAGFARYHEPFVGGGALFFALRERGLAAAALLADRNPELVNLYEVVRDAPEALIAELARHRNTAELYYQVRGQHPDDLPPVARAARTLFLNRTGFNGLYRVNRDGLFNVPYGRQQHTDFFQPAALRRAHRALAGAEVRCADFERALAPASPGDFVYLDPPYATGMRAAKGFAAYQAGGFTDADHRRLADAVRRLDRAGVLILASNSDCALVRELYAGYRIEPVSIRRQVGGHVDRRGSAAEVLISNYDPGGRLPGL